MLPTPAPKPAQERLDGAVPNSQFQRKAKGDGREVTQEGPPCGDGALGQEPKHFPSWKELALHLPLPFLYRFFFFFLGVSPGTEGLRGACSLPSLGTAVGTARGPPVLPSGNPSH